jgi:hypothetical protein
MAMRRASTKGFKRTSTLLTDRIRAAGESRGFAVSRLLTHWPEIAGEDIAEIARPVNVSYGRGGLGATLTVLTTGAQAPMLEMQKEKLRVKVNAVYGYNAIARVMITQTAATGFSEGHAQFEMRPKLKPDAAPDLTILKAAKDVTRPVENEDLRSALEVLAKNVLTKAKR